MILLFYERVVNINKHGPPDCKPCHVLAATFIQSLIMIYFLLVSMGGILLSSLEISVEDKIKRRKSPRIHLAVFLRGSRSSGRPSARSLLYCLHVLPLLRAIPAGCNTTLCRLQLSLRSRRKRGRGRGAGEK